MTPSVLVLVLAFIFYRAGSSAAFTAGLPAFRQRTVPVNGKPALLMMTGDLFVDSAETVRAGDFHVPGAEENLQDPNGKEYTVGATVRVGVEGLKFFQIPPKGAGHYDDNKNFVQQREEPENEKKSLKLPVGMRGTVTKVYDEREISANLPIQVKFEPGKNTEEGYDPPVAFVMHFMAHELECV